MGSGMSMRMRMTTRGRGLLLGLCVVLGASASLAACSDSDASGNPGVQIVDDGSAGTRGNVGSDTQGNTATDGQTAGPDSAPGEAQQPGGSTGDEPAAPDTGDDTGDDTGTIDDEPVVFIDAECGPNDTPETGLQGDAYPGTVNCGLTLLSEIPMGGHVQGSGHCAYLRIPGPAPYTGSVIKAYSLADPLNPVETDEEPAIGGSESMRAHTTDERAVLVSGSGVYDVSNCEDMVKKGEIPWPSQNAQAGFYLAALTSHEIALSHDANRVYSGLGFAVADISNLDQPDTWTVKNWSCEMNIQSDFPGTVPNACEGDAHQDVGRQYSHSSDDNLEGTVWYGANQEGSASQMEPATARMVDISDPGSITILDTLPEFPGHSMNWWRTRSGREFIIGANEGLGAADSCVPYPRPKNLGNALDAYIVEVTGNQFGEPFPLTLDINKPDNCEAARASGARASISETSMYNRNGAAFVMIEYGGAGLRVFDLRDGDNPREVAYYNDGRGHVHSGVFHYDDARGIMLASGSRSMQVLMLQPQMIEALGLPQPTDPGYPYVE